jgi:hypothetical protein
MAVLAGALVAASLNGRRSNTRVFGHGCLKLPHHRAAVANAEELCKSNSA